MKVTPKIIHTCSAKISAQYLSPVKRYGEKKIFPNFYFPLLPNLKRKYLQNRYEIDYSDLPNLNNLRTRSKG
jgi:hypothetical protein